jgi:acylphosphatase
MIWSEMEDPTTLSVQDRVHIRLTGRVHGIGYRAFVQRTGLLLGLNGWVRNVGDDQVEITAEGLHSTLEEFIQAVSHGPAGARVDEVQVEWEQPANRFNRFDIEYSV